MIKNKFSHNEQDMGFLEDMMFAWSKRKDQNFEVKLVFFEIKKDVVKNLYEKLKFDSYKDLIKCESDFKSLLCDLNAVYHVYLIWNWAFMFIPCIVDLCCNVTLKT